MDPITGMLILGGLNAGMGAMKANQQAKQRKSEAMMKAAEIEASPWTGRAPTTQVSTPEGNAWAEMAGGLVNAAGQTASLQNAGLFKAAPEAAAITPGAAEAPTSLLMPQANKQEQSIWGNMANMGRMKA